MDNCHVLLVMAVWSELGSRQEWRDLTASQVVKTAVKMGNLASDGNLGSEVCVELYLGSRAWVPRQNHGETRVQRTTGQETRLTSVTGEEEVVEGGSRSDLWGSGQWMQLRTCGLCVEVVDPSSSAADSWRPAGYDGFQLCAGLGVSTSNCNRNQLF